MDKAKPLLKQRISKRVASSRAGTSSRKQECSAVLVASIEATRANLRDRLQSGQRDIHSIKQMQRGRAHGIRRCPLKYPGLLCRATYHTGPFIARHVTRRNTYYGGARVINWIVALHYSCFRRASKLFDSFRIQPVDR